MIGRQPLTRQFGGGRGTLYMLDDLSNGELQSVKTFVASFHHDEDDTGREAHIDSMFAHG